MKSPYSSSHPRGFTLVEVLTVIAIIVVLMGLTLGISGFVQDKAARARAEGEIAAMEAALEQYRIDNGGYPYTDPDEDYLAATNPHEVAKAMDDGGAPIDQMEKASLLLFQALYGVNSDGSVVDDNGNRLKTYFNFPPSMLQGADDDEFDPAAVTAILDPWGNPYGYYVPNPTDPNTLAKNPTFDLYSTANTQPKVKAIKGGDDDDEDDDEDDEQDPPAWVLKLQDAWVTNW